MNAQTLLELSDVRDRQSQMACIGCHEEQSSDLAGYVSDAWDCLWSPIECTKAAVGSTEESAEAWRKVKQPDASVSVPRTPVPYFPRPPVRPYIGPECPPQLKSGCQAPGKFDPMTCTCDVPQPPARVTVPEGCQPPNIYDPVSKMCYQTSGVTSEPWYRQPPVLIALGLGVVALALSVRAK